MEIHIFLIASDLQIYGWCSRGKVLNRMKIQCVYGPDSAEERLDLGTVKQNSGCRDKERRKVSHLSVTPSVTCTDSIMYKVKSNKMFITLLQIQMNSKFKWKYYKRKKL